MRVFYAGNPSATMTLYVCPAADAEGIKGGVISDWLDHEGQPKTMTVHFNGDGVEVPDELGRYLLARKLVRKTALIVPEGVAA